MRTTTTRKQHGRSGVCNSCHCCSGMLSGGDRGSSRHRPSRSGRTGEPGHGMTDVCHIDNNRSPGDDDVEGADSSTC